MTKFKQGDTVINKNGLRKIVYRVDGGYFYTGVSARYLMDDFELHEPDTSKAIKLLIDAGYTVTPPKPKLTGKVVIVMTPSGNVYTITKDRYDRNDFSVIIACVLAIVDWTEGEGI